ncbi:hypothetical protein DL98DRAFT_526836 [Cadophora sp. DSE1049]|nr:hypothetical protein DL98DRAFT_526836 [Cadophora sp. DSE1049]
MTLNKCTICDKETANKCAKSKSAVYCSQECQKLDFPLHKLLCTKITTFLENNPRPADEDLSTHKLGLLFPVDAKNPESCQPCLPYLLSRTDHQRISRVEGPTGPVQVEEGQGGD